MAWISNLLRTLRVKSTVQQNFFILVDLLKWLCHFINDLKNCLRDWFWKYISFILLHKWKIHLKKKGMIKKKKKNTETKESMENRKTSHDSRTLGGGRHWAMTPRNSAWVCWAKTQGPTPWTCSKMWYSMLHNGKKAAAYTKAFS